MKKETIILVLIIIAAFVVRLYKIDNPVADWHSWRQADTSAVTRNFVKFGFNPFYPRYDDLSNIQSGHDNPMGYRFVEFPIYNSISYFFIEISHGIFTIEIWQRLVSIFASLISLYLIYRLTAHLASSRAGLWAAFFFGLLPFSVYYSRVILPEPLMIALSLGALYTFIVWSKKEDKIGWLILSGMLVSLAILTKPFAVFFFPPLLYLVITKTNRTAQNSKLLLLYAAIALVPFGLWRLFMTGYPEGVPASDWLFNKDNIRGKGSFFFWLFAQRISKLILGYFGAFFLLTGILADGKKKENWFFHILGLSMLSYLFIFAGGNVQHDYYQIILVPILVMYLGRGIDFLLVHSGTLFRPSLVYGIITIVVAFTFGFSWYNIRTYYWVNNPIIVTAGKKADGLLPKNAKVIAPLGGDTAFLYQINRQGWPQGFEIEDKMLKGATAYVSITPDDPEVTYVKSKYPTLYEGNGFIIIVLQ